jgi:plastocyanin
MIRARVLALVPLVLLPLAACGDDDGGGDGSGTASGNASDTAGEGEAPVSLEGEVNNHGTEQLSGDSVDMELDDNYFAPTFVEGGEAGATVTVNLDNEGERRHSFTIDGTDVNLVVEPGDDGTAEVTLPDSGSLNFYCRFHRNSGMQGAFVVT